MGLETPEMLEQIKAAVAYDPATGGLTWLPRDPAIAHTRAWNTRWAGKPALNNRHSDGYRVGTFYSICFLAHRVCFALAHGRWPNGCIDHVNGNRSDNRIANLRECTLRENNRNTARRGKSGFKGVYQYNQRWYAAIDIGSRVRLSLGGYSTPEEAARAYDRAALKHHGPFACVNFPTEGARHAA